MFRLSCALNGVSGFLDGLAQRSITEKGVVGDNAAIAEAVATAGGIGEVISRALPAAKALVITGRQAFGRPAARDGARAHFRSDASIAD